MKKRFVWGLTGLVLLALGATACGPELSSTAISIQSPIETPTATPTPTSRPSATPTPLQGTPTPPGETPTAVPTAPGPLPPGPKLVYYWVMDKGVVGFWAASAVAPSERALLTTTQQPHSSTQAALSHDGTQIAYVVSNSAHRWEADLWTVRIDGTDRRQIATGVDMGRWVNYPLWSPDDRFLAILRTQHETSPQVDTFPYVQTISMIDVASGKETPLVRSTVPDLKNEMSLYIFPVDWSANGGSFFYRTGAGGNVELWQVDVDSLETAFVATISEMGIPRCYFLSPDSQWLLCSVQVSHEPPEYAVVRVPTEQGGAAEVLVRGALEDKYSPVWGPANDQVTINLPLSADNPAQLQTLNVNNLQRTTLDSSDGANFVPFAWSPDGQWLAASKNPDQQVLLVARDGSQIVPVEGIGPFIGWLDN